MRRKRGLETDDSSPNDWLNTYADLVSLLLTFFVLLYSITTINVQKFQALIMSINKGLGVEQVSQINIKPEGGKKIVETKNKNPDELKRLYDELNNYINNGSLKNKVQLVLNERGLTIRFVDTVLFDSGKAVLKPEALDILRGISNYLRNDTHPIRVEGYTDNVPINNSKYPSNWELSTDRAVTVLKFLENIIKISPERISAAGYGEYKPILPNTSDANRAKNRRVDIVILREYGQ